MKESPSLYRLGALVSQQITPQDIQHEEWSEIIGLSLQHGLAPMLLWVTKRNAPQIATEPVWTPIIAETRRAAVHHIMLDAARKQVGAALDEAHIPSLWLKGIALAAIVYPQPVLRPMGDLDVLVPYEQREEAMRVAQGIGYDLHETEGQLINPEEIVHLNFTHHYCLRGGIDDSVLLELHFRLLSSNNILLPLAKLTWFWDQTTRIQNDDTFTILRPEAHLLYLCAHAILQHGEISTSLRQYFDLHRLIMGSTIDWELVIKQAKALGWSFGAHRALTLSSRHFPTAIPEHVFLQLQVQNAKDPAADRVARFSNKGWRWERITMKAQGMSFVQKCVLVYRFLIPSKAYLRKRYGIHSDRFLVIYYPYRWFDISREFFWAMWNRAKRRLR